MVKCALCLPAYLCPAAQISHFFHFPQSERGGEHFTHEKLLTSCPFPYIHPYPQAYRPSPTGSTPHTPLINSQQAPLLPPLPSLPTEEVISANVSVVRALGGPCGGQWLATNCYSHFRSKEAPYLALLCTSSPPAQPHPLSDIDLGGATTVGPH